MEETFPAADLLPLTVEAIELARAYLDAAVVPETYADDARHVAIAVVHDSICSLAGTSVTWSTSADRMRSTP